MFNKNVHSHSAEDKKLVRKPYHKPELEILGDLRSLTLGGSFGTGESNSLTRKVARGIPLPGDYPFDNPGASGNY